MDWESYRALTRGGLAKALVFTFPSGRLVMRERLGPYAARDSSFDSMAELEKTLRKKRWKLERVKWFT